MTPRLRFLSVIAVLVALAPGATGCFNPFNPRVAPSRGNSEQAPAPSSPRNVLELFKWSWEHRAYEEYRQIFSDDFRFASSEVDTAGNGDQSRVESREDELASAKHLFQGGKADEPPANRITLDFSSDLVALPDPRPGKTYPVHQVIQTSVTLSVDTDNESFRVTGDARFFMVRGDSAVIPSDLGVGRDENRWYIERWEDLTGGTGQAAAAPSLESFAASSPRPPYSRRGTGEGLHGGPRPVAMNLDVTWTFLKRLYR